MAIVQMAKNAQPGLKLAGLLLLLLVVAPAAGRAQSSPAISIVLSPGHMVPQDTAITATVTLENLDPGSYSSLVFRADLTEWDQHYPASTSCEGEDTGEDIPVEVNASRETFTVEVWKSCSVYIYAHYTLDAALFRLDSSAPGGKVELASAETRFAMSRYLEAGEIPPPAAAAAVAGWLDPDPTSFEWKVGEWVVFRTRTDILQYLNSHVGVRGGGWPDGAIADHADGMDAEEACRNGDDGSVNWRRAINQPLKLVACQAGEAIMEVWHETEVERLSTYKFRIRPAGGGGGGDHAGSPGFDHGADGGRGWQRDLHGGVGVAADGRCDGNAFGHGRRRREGVGGADLYVLELGYGADRDGERRRRRRHGGRNGDGVARGGGRQLRLGDGGLGGCDRDRQRLAGADGDG